MRFLRRNQYALCFLALVVVCSVMVIRGVTAGQTAHVERREDFILLHSKGERGRAERLYQLLIQELPNLNDGVIADDLQRTAMLVDAKAPEPGNLLWKYHISLRNELENRAERRLARAQQESEKP